MKDFQLIDDVMPDVPPADPARVMAVRARLSDGGRRRRLPAWSRVSLAAVAVAAVLAGGFVVVPRLGAGQVDSASTADPVAVLGAAADRLAAQPPATGAWWRQETLEVTRRMQKKGGASYTVEERNSDVTWRNPDGLVKQERTRLSVAPLTPADEKAWQDAGSPLLCPTKSECRLGRTMFTPLAKRPLEYPVGPVTQLPADAEALKAELLKDFPPTAPESQESFLWRLGRWLLVSTETTPGTRAALYRMLAALPGAQVVDGVPDLEGRVGVAVLEPPRDHPTQEQLIIDRQSGELLAVRDVLVKPYSAWPEIQVGPFLWYQVKQLGWTDQGPRS